MRLAIVIASIAGVFGLVFLAGHPAGTVYLGSTQLIDEEGRLALEEDGTIFDQQRRVVAAPRTTDLAQFWEVYQVDERFLLINASSGRVLESVPAMVTGAQAATVPWATGSSAQLWRIRSGYYHGPYPFGYGASYVGDNGLMVVPVAGGEAFIDGWWIATTISHDVLGIRLRDAL